MPWGTDSLNRHTTNIQYGVDVEYVMWAMTGHQLTDTTTILSFLEDFKVHLPKKYLNVIVDA